MKKFLLFVLILPVSLFADELTDYYSDASGISSSAENIRQIAGENVEALVGNMTATFNGSSVSDVFKVFALQTDLNIMVSPNVDAEISATFSDASIYDAFMAILSANGLYYLEQGNIIKIMTQDEYLTELARGYLITRSFDAGIVDLENLSTVLKPLMTSDVSSLTVDEQSSRIIVTDVEEVVEDIEAILEEISRPPAMIQIETKIIQIELEDEDEFGINWSALNIADAVNLSFPMFDLSNVSSTAFLADACTSINNTPLTVDAAISAVSETKDLTVLAQPLVVALNREEAWIHIGSKVPYVDEFTKDATTDDETGELDFVDVGIQLTVTPVITEDGMVMMTIEANNSSYQMIDVTSTQNAPLIIATELECDAVVNDGDTIIIGGLIQTEESEEVHGVPILSKIPILKYLFSYTETVENRSELVIFLTPTIILAGENNLSSEILSDEMQNAAGLSEEDAAE